MKAVRGIVNVVTAVMLAVLFIGAGFMVCTVPPVTHAFSTVFAQDDISPYDRNQLVRVADATRDYSFASHDKQALLGTIYDVAVEYRDAVGYAASSTTGFPKVALVTDSSNVSQLEAAFAGASELYCYSKDTVSHLDDCFAIATVAYPGLIASAIIAVAGLVFSGVTGKRRRAGVVVVASGAVVLALFAALGVMAAVNFDGFFAAFHGLFFSQGTWTFPYDSLLICSLPTPFWMGMGAVWLVVTAALSVAAILVGRKLMR